MLVTLEGIVMLVKPLQPRKAFSPMMVTPEGIVMLVKPDQFLKVSSGITVALESMMTLCTLLNSLKAETTLELGGIVTLVKPLQP
jgi:hypothetical protein